MRQVYTGQRLTTGATTIKCRVLGAVVINKALTGTVTIADGATTIAVLTNGTTAPLGTVMFGGPDGAMGVSSSLTFTLSATEDITVLYNG